jgi:putative redox protein
MKARVKWVEGMSFLAESGSGHMVVMDGAPEAGGRNLAPRPMEMVLMGTGACTCFDVVLILQRSRADVRDCVVEISSERADTDPKVFTRIHMHFIVSGRKLKADQVKRAIDLSAEKYCSASIMLGKTAIITHDFAVVDSEADAVGGVPA